MYEFSVARKYLIPRVRQLSVSCISLISVVVIATVVWLSIVFFSVQEGIEKRWTEKMIALTAPIRITPTPAYYKSYYFQIDAFSSASEFTHKSLREKLAAAKADPYDPDEDPSLPTGFVNRTSIDLVKEAQKTILSIPGLSCDIFDTALATLKLRLIRDESPFSPPLEQLISQSSYLVSFDPQNPLLSVSLQPISAQDVQNVLHSKESAKVLSQIQITEVTVPETGWNIPSSFLPEGSRFQVVISTERGLERSIILLSNTRDTYNQELFEKGVLTKKENQLFFTSSRGTENVTRALLFLAGGQKLAASHKSSLLFSFRTTLQGQLLTGEAPIGPLAISQFTQLPTRDNALWVDKRNGKWVLPEDKEYGEGILLPKSFRDAGALVGDRGTLNYQAFGATSLQEQRAPVFVAGFYDPGILPTGGKVVLARSSLVSRIQDASFTEEQTLPTGFNVHFNDLKKADAIKKELLQLFKKEGIAPYWDIRTYEEFDFTKDILQQMKSDKNLFSLISFIIMIVACSNIVSMLIILVHDKKKEIAILRALGASKKSIGAIFGLCGFTMGITGSIAGAGLAILTLHNLTFLLQFLSSLQGFEVLNTAFYGNTLPSQVSYEALIKVIGSCAFTSTIAGVIAAIQASRINTSEALRNE